jgi:hypothetical protein
MLKLKPLDVRRQELARSTQRLAHGSGERIDVEVVWF